MAKEKKLTSKPRGRPQKEIDKKQFESLCRLQCTLEEIASFLNISMDTIERWCKREYEANFAEVFRAKRAGGKVSLRRTQFKLAETSPAMAIFLGKQFLGQTDKSAVDMTATVINTHILTPKVDDDSTS